MSTKDEMLAVLSNQMADLLMEFMRLAREDLKDYPLDEIRPILLEALPDKLRPMVDDMEARIAAALDQAGDGVLEVAATLLSKFDRLSGGRAADIVRQLKTDHNAFTTETLNDMDAMLKAHISKTEDEARATATDMREDFAAALGPLLRPRSSAPPE